MKYPCDNLKSMLYVGGENVVPKLWLYIYTIYERSKCKIHVSKMEHF
jgi:hypothetical protein